MDNADGYGEVAIVKYNAGNIASVVYALERIGAKAVVTDDPQRLMDAERVLFPGVGEASSAMASLRASGLDKLLPKLKNPVLAICVGMQLLCERSEENDTPCLGIVDATVRKFPPRGPSDRKVPQIGWNKIGNLRSPLFRNVDEGAYCYFVHSYYVPLGPTTIAETGYGPLYGSALQKDNFYGLQFHVEKSAKVGETILRNFMELPIGPESKAGYIN